MAKVKDDNSTKSKKKAVTQDASPESSSSRRSSRETSSRKQTKENPSSTRKSERLEKLKPSGTTPIKEKSERTQEKINTTPMKKYNRRNKHTSLDSSGSKKSVEEPASSNTKSKKGKVNRSLKQCMVDAKEDKTHKKQGRKRKRVASSVDKALPTESQDKSSQANSSSNRGTSGSKSAEDKDDNVEEFSDGTGEESTHKGSQTQCSTSNSSLTNFEVEEINEEGGHNGESIENGSDTPNGKEPSSKKETPLRKTDSDACTDIKEFWVPVQISNVQLEQYCSTLLSNSMALSSCSKSDTFGALHDILTSNRKCCDHPYIVDQSLQGALTKDLEPAKFLEVGIKASGKLQFLDLVLPEIKKQKLRVLILFQPLSGSGKDSTSIGDILDDFVRQRFGEESYERVDAIGTINSKRQAALNNFNNKEMGRFIFLLDYRACHSSIKLSSIDTIVIFDSDWNPANDLRALQKIAIDSKLEQIKIFRLYTLWTLEEKILKLADHNVTIEKGLQNLSRSISDALLMWGATYLFKKLDEFHTTSVTDISSEECFHEVKEEFLNLISEKDCTSKLILTRSQQSGGGYGQNLGLPNELPDGEQPHTFWRKFLAGKNPCWKYLSRSTPRQRKRPQFFESLVAPKKPNNDDVGRKRKKTSNNIVEPVASDPVIEKVSSSDGIWSAANCNEKSFRILLKINISELCQVLKLAEDVKIMTERFLDYVIENYRVNKEPAKTLQAFLISLCWIGCDLLKKKLDRKQSLALAKKHLKFSCEEEDTDSVFLKLEPAKEMFLLHKKNKPVKVEIPDSPEDVYVTISPDTSDAPEDQKDSDGSNTNNSPSAPELEQKLPPIEDNLQTKEAEKVDQINSEYPSAEKVDQINSEYPLAEKVDQFNPVVVENQPNVDIIPPAEEPVVENTPNVHTNASAEIPSENPFQNSVHLEMNPDLPNHAVMPPGPNLLGIQRSENHNHNHNRVIANPLLAEIEKLCDLKNTVVKFYEAIKQKLKADFDKEVAEMIAQMSRKYEAKCQHAETAFQLKKNEIDMNLNRVLMNKILAEAFRTKCQDLSSTDPIRIQVSQSGGMHSMQFLHQGMTSSSGSQQQHLQPPLEIVHQSAKLFSTTPTMSTWPPPSTISTITTPSTRPPPPPSNFIPTTTPPTRPPPNVTPFTRLPPPSNISTATTPPTRPPPNITQSTRLPSPPPPPPSNIIPTSTPIRPPPNISNITPSTRPPPNTNPLSTPTRPPPNINSTTIRGEIRGPAPHIRPFKPSTSMSPHDIHRVRTMLGHHASSSLPMSHTPAKPPSYPTNHNTHPPQNSSQPEPPPPLQPSSSLHSFFPSEQQPPPAMSSSLPPLPSIPVAHPSLYRPDILSQPALDMLMDIDKQAGLHQPNMLSSQPTAGGGSGGGGGDGELVCLSDDD